MNAEFMSALDSIAKERKISKEILIDALSAALSSAYKKNYNCEANVRVTIDQDTGEFHIYIQKIVVEEVERPHSEITLEDAKEINKIYQIGDLLEVEAHAENFGRIAAMTAKQVVVQRIREAERGVIYEQFQKSQNEVLTAIVQRADTNVVYIEINNTPGVIPQQEMMQNEQYETGMKLKVYVIEVKQSNRGPQIIVSRTHPGLVKRLFELEVPEIAQNVVQIRAIAREAGYRTKVAVYSTDQKIDPVGACVGQRGSRVERIVDELHNEKIDIIEWDNDPAVYIAKSLSPSKVLMVYINESEKAARVIVPDNQLSLAIGKEGQNARLAAKLTGWKIDIKSQSQSEREFAGELYSDSGAKEIDDEYADFNDVEDFDDVDGFDDVENTEGEKHVEDSVDIDRADG
ncbi:MAG: transcription termination factor NusA [Clostridia bacterium]